MTDWELIQQYTRDGSADAMCELVRRHAGMVRATALRQVRDPHTADDVTQAVFLVLMRRARELKPSVILGGWLFKTTLHAAADAREKSATRARYEREVSRMDVSPEIPSPMMLQETLAVLNDALARLPAADRDAIVLRYLEGQSAATVAAALGTSQDAARQRLSRALERLRKHLARLGVVTAVAALLVMLDSLPAQAAAPLTLTEQIQGVVRGSAMPSPQSQILAQGVHRMIRNRRLKRTAAFSALAAAVILTVGIPLAISQTPPTPAPPRAFAAVPPAGPSVQVAQVNPANANIPAIASPVTSGEMAPPDAEKSAVAYNTAFAADLYQVVNNKDNVDKNLFLSPYSISTVLGLTAAGARGRTAEQMRKVLHISDMNTLNWGIADLAAELSDTQGGQRPYQLSIANALWESTRYPMVPAFTALSAKYYNTSGIYTVDFAKDPEAARVRINKWVEEKTNDKIKDLLPDSSPPPITKATAMVLTNAIYFKASWNMPFSPRGTTNQPFHVTPQKDVQVSLMTVGGSYKFFENDDFQAVALPYKAVVERDPQSASMLILLPKKTDGLAALEKQLTAGNLAQWQSDMAFRTGQVLLPRFTITSEIKLNDTLKAMGMTDAFDMGAADFRNMVTIVPGDNVYISGVFHKAFVNVDEEGTEAAAATAVAGAGGGRPLNPFVFRADHPFFFIIQYDPTRSILFMGHVVEPPPPGAAAPVASSPARRGPIGPATNPFKDASAAATAAADLVKAQLADTAFISDANHPPLLRDLTALDTAAQAVLTGTGTPAQMTPRANTLLRALNQVNTTAYAILNRPSESQESKDKATALSVKIRAITGL